MNRLETVVFVNFHIKQRKGGFSYDKISLFLMSFSIIRIGDFCFFRNKNFSFYEKTTVSSLYSD